MFMIFVLIVVGVAFLLVMVLIVGRFFPEEYLSEVRHTSRQSPEKIWPLLFDPKAVCYGGKQARSVTVISEDGEPLRWREDLGPSKFTAGVVETTENERVMTLGTDSVVPMEMERTIQLERNDAGTTVTIHQRILIRKGTWHVPIFRIMMSLGAATAGVKDYLRRLANAVGEKPDLS